MNKSILLGRLTADPELRTTAGGVSVCNFRLAVNRRFKNADGEYETDFIPCVAWRNQAEFISKYFEKGSLIAVSGSIQTRNFENKDGQKVFVTEVAVDEVDFAGNKKKDGASSSLPDLPDMPQMPDAPSDDLPF